MVNSKQMEENLVTEGTYKSSKKRVFKMMFLANALFLLGFINNFPLSTILQNKIEQTLAKNKNCPINYSNLQLSLFLPNLSLKKPVINGRCYGQRNSNLNLDLLALKSDGISFSPPGLRLKTQIKGEKSKLDIFPTLTFTGSKTRIKKSKLNAQMINRIIGGNYLQGQFLIDAVLDSSFSELTGAKLLIKSTDLLVPGQSISGFQLPSLPLKNFKLKGTLKNNKFKVMAIELGDKNSPIIAKFNGDINVNQKAFDQSKINLIGKVKFSADFLNDFSILNLLLTGKKDKEGYYKMKLTGSLNKLNKPQFL